MKNYTVTYFIKANRQEFEKTMPVVAMNAKEACSICKDIVKAKTGKTAFRPVAKAQ